MKSIDNKIKYYELLMCYDDTSKYINYELPSGYHYEFYKDGLHDVYVYSNGKVDEYEYFYEDDKIKLVRKYI